jgi:ABC-type multidrug transport system permease subunit
MTDDLGMLGRQVRHDLTGIARTPVVLFFAIAFPLGFFLVISSFVGNETIDFRSGVRVAQFLAPAFASFGIAMATFSFLAIGFAEIRFSGVLKRFTGSPLPTWVLLGGRIGAGTVLAFAAVVLLLLVGVLFFDVQVLWARLPGVVVTVALTAVSFGALGLVVAALAPSMQAAVALANGIAIGLAFISDLFVVAELPGYLDTIGWVFPLKHVVNALGDAFNPFVDTTGFFPDHLAVIAAWGLAGALLAAWAIRRDARRAEAGHSPAAAPSAAVARRHRADAQPRRTRRPALAALVSDQARHVLTAQRRDWSSVFFGVAFPVLLVLLLTTVFGAGEGRTIDGVLLAQLFSATMTVYGAAVIAVVNLPQALAEARQNGVLKRWQGTPLPVGAVLGGQAVAAVVLSLVAMVLVYAVSVAVYDVAVPPSWPSAVVVLVVSALSFAAIGMAVVTATRSGQSALAICLGSLITLSFFSDIFIVGVDFPTWLDAVSWFFPLRHAVNAFEAAMAADATGWVLDPVHLGVIVAWGVLATLVAAWRFSPEPASRPPSRRPPSRRARAPKEPKEAVAVG